METYPFHATFFGLKSKKFPVGFIFSWLMCLGLPIHSLPTHLDFLHSYCMRPATSREITYSALFPESVDYAFYGVCQWEISCVKMLPVT